MKTSAAEALFATFFLCFTATTGVSTAYHVLKISEMVSSFGSAWGFIEEKLAPEPGSPYYQEKRNPEEYLMRDRPTFFANKDEEALIQKMSVINSQIASIESMIIANHRSIMDKLDSIPKEIFNRMKADEVLNMVRDIEVRYRTFATYIQLVEKEGNTSSAKSTLKDQARFIISYAPRSPVHFLDSLHHILIPDLEVDKLLNKQSFLSIFADFLVCELLLLLKENNMRFSSGGSK